MERVVLDASDRIRLIHPGHLVVDLPESFPARLRHLVSITRVASHHRSPLRMIVDDRSCDASSVLEILAALGSAPRPRRVSFLGEDAALLDLRALCAHLTGPRADGPLPAGLAYLAEAAAG